MIKYDIKMGDKVVNNCNVEKAGKHYSIVVDEFGVLSIEDAMILVLAKYIDNIEVSGFVPCTTYLDELYNERI